MKSTIVASLALGFTYTTALLLPPLLPSHQPAELKPRDQTISLNATQLIGPRPPGYYILVDLFRSDPLTPEKVYLVAIAGVEDWAYLGWDHILPSRSPRNKMEMYGIVLAWRSLVTSTAQHRLHMSYLILGMLDLINEMTRHEFCVSTALITMYRQPTGLIRFLAAGRNDFGTPEEEPVTENATLHTVQSQNLTAPRRIVDPQDPDSAILYERKGKVMSSVDFLSTVLYAVATAAQDDNGEYCEDLAGFNEQRSVVYRIRGLEHTVSGYLLTYGIVRTGLKLLSKAVYRERTSGEMHISFEYRGDVLGHGHIDLSDFAHGTER